MNHILKHWLAAGSGQKIFLLRHGEIQGAGGEKRFIGQTNVPLNNQGGLQAECWRQWLAGVPLARIIASDLIRCTQTARIIAAGRSVPVEALTGLREICLGQWDGMSFGRVKQRWPDAFQQRGLDIARFRPPGGENFRDLQQRVIPVFEKVVNQATVPILIVTHAGVNRVILCHILGIPIDDLFSIDQSYAAMNLIDHHAGRYRVHSLNLRPDPEEIIRYAR